MLPGPPSMLPTNVRARMDAEKQRRAINTGNMTMQSANVHGLQSASGGTPNVQQVEVGNLPNYFPASQPTLSTLSQNGTNWTSMTARQNPTSVINVHRFSDKTVPMATGMPGTLQSNVRAPTEAERQRITTNTANIESRNVHGVQSANGSISNIRQVIATNPPVWAHQFPASQPTIPPSSHNAIAWRPMTPLQNPTPILNAALPNKTIPMSTRMPGPPLLWPPNVRTGIGAEKQSITISTPNITMETHFPTIHGIQSGNGSVSSVQQVSTNPQFLHAPSRFPASPPIIATLSRNGTVHSSMTPTQNGIMSVPKLPDVPVHMAPKIFGPPLLLPPDVRVQMEAERQRRSPSTTQLPPWLTTRLGSEVVVDKASSHTRSHGSSFFLDCSDSSTGGEKLKHGNASQSDGEEVLESLAKDVGMLVALAICRPWLILSWLTVADQIRLQSTCRSLRYRGYNQKIATRVARADCFISLSLKEVYDRSLIYPFLPRKRRGNPDKVPIQWTKGDLRRLMQVSEVLDLANDSDDDNASFFNEPRWAEKTEEWLIGVPRGHCSCLKFAALGEIEGVDADLGKCVNINIAEKTGLPRWCFSTRDLKIHCPGYYSVMLYTVGRFPQDEARATVETTVTLAGGSSVTVFDSSSLGRYAVYAHGVDPNSSSAPTNNLLGVICIRPKITLPDNTKKLPETSYNYEEQFPIEVHLKFTIDFSSERGASEFEQANVPLVAIGLAPTKQRQLVEKLESIGPYGNNILLGSLCVQINPAHWMDRYRSGVPFGF